MTGNKGPEWKVVAEAPLKKHDGRLVTYEGSVLHSLPERSKLRPCCTACVARPEALGRICVVTLIATSRNR